MIWETHDKHQEPQNDALGEFDLADPGLEVWCRSRYNTHQKPFVFSATGAVVAEYAMDDVAPKGWTDEGVEVIYTLDWTGATRRLCCAKERHTAGDVGVFAPMTGRFVLRLREKADRLYVADVAGDAREEILVLASTELHIYHNADPSVDPTAPRPWKSEAYRRAKLTHNYYSP